MTEADCLDRQHRRNTGATNHRQRRRSAYRASGLVLRRKGVCSELPERSLRRAFRLRIAGKRANLCRNAQAARSRSLPLCCHCCVRCRLDGADMPRTSAPFACGQRNRHRARPMESRRFWFLETLESAVRRRLHVDAMARGISAEGLRSLGAASSPRPRCTELGSCRSRAQAANVGPFRRARFWWPVGVRSAAPDVVAFLRERGRLSGSLMVAAAASLSPKTCRRVVRPSAEWRR